jgi:Putative transposase/Transposase zinc-binding domain
MSCCGSAGPPAGLQLAEVLRLGLKAPPFKLPTHHWKILRALLVCRTLALGGHRYGCQQCGQSHFVPHSCRNRHCPLCQGQAAHRWLEQQERALLPVPYFHLVFTLPHVLNPLIQQNQRALYTLLFAAASQTLLQFGQNRFGVQLGITAVLHTWSQTLVGHYHLHCIVTGGGLTRDGSRWVSTGGKYLFAVRALSAVFRGKFCAGLQQLQTEQQLQFHGQLAPQAQPKAFAQLLHQATRQKWVVYAKRPFAGPKQVLAYLSRYTHRVALSPRRLLALDEPKQIVTFAWKDYADGAKRKTMSLEVKEFLRRFCLHLLPKAFVKIRHFGFLSNRQRQTRVAQARALLQPQASPRPATDEGQTGTVATETTPGPVCPYCGSTRLWLMEIVPAMGRLGRLVPTLDSS